MAKDRAKKQVKLSFRFNTVNFGEPETAREIFSTDFTFEFHTQKDAKSFANAVRDNFNALMNGKVDEIRVGHSSFTRKILDTLITQAHAQKTADLFLMSVRSKAPQRKGLDYLSSGPVRL